MNITFHRHQIHNKISLTIKKATFLNVSKEIELSFHLLYKWTLRSSLKKYVTEVEADAMNRTVKIIQEFNYTSDRHNDRFFYTPFTDIINFFSRCAWKSRGRRPACLCDSFSITRSWFTVQNWFSLLWLKIGYIY